MPKVSVNGIQLHYLQVGQGPNVVLLHGLGGNLAVWFLHLVDNLRGSFRLTACDLRGHGKSEMPPTGYTTAHMAQDLAGLLDALNIEKIHLIGHSFGADIALHFTLLFPERVDRLVLLEPGIAALLKYRKSQQWVGWDYWVGKLAEFGIQVPPEKKFDIDYLKIDQSFIRNLELDMNDIAISEAIIVMAHTLGLKVIAEGVESEGQQKILMNAGCDYAQGYLYSKPVTADELEVLLNEQYEINDAKSINKD